MNKIALKDKYALTIREATQYFGIGEKNLYKLASEHADEGDFAFRKGRHYMIIREEFQKFLVDTSSI